MIFIFSSLIPSLTFNTLQTTKNVQVCLEVRFEVIDTFTMGDTTSNIINNSVSFHSEFSIKVIPLEMLKFYKIIENCVYHDTWQIQKKM